jgi:hypothetical protein
MSAAFWCAGARGNVGLQGNGFLRELDTPYHSAWRHSRRLGYVPGDRKTVITGLVPTR